VIRTQVYLPEETHKNLLLLARQKDTTLSKLIRQGADHVIKKNYGKLSPQQKTLKFLANPPQKYRVNLTGKNQLLSLLLASQTSSVMNQKHSSKKLALTVKLFFRQSSLQKQSSISLIKALTPPASSKSFLTLI
jgi:hypothetical protein